MSGALAQDFGGSDSEEEDFNPEPALESDNEDNGDDDEKPAVSRPARRASLDDDDDEQGRNGSSKNRSKDRRLTVDDEDDEDDAKPTGRARAGDEEDADEDGDKDDNDEDEDEDEEDDEDDEEVTGHARKKRRKDRRNQFIDVEAEVDEDEDEEIEEDDDLPGEDVHPDDMLELPPGADRDDRKHRELDRQRDLDASMDAEKQAALLVERYGRNRAVATNSTVVPQHLLLPSVEDPSIWRLRCKFGKEREVVFAIMKRIEDRAGTREPCQIISAFERGGVMAGMLYVEARTLVDVTSALEGLQGVYMGTKPLLIPIGEMPDLLRTKKSKELDPGMYVRIKRGKYAGDLAQIDAVESNGLEVTLRIIPRLDYGLNDDVNSANGDVKRKRPGGAGAANSGVRPPPRLFSETEARKRHGKFLTSGGIAGRNVTYMGDTYEDGYLIKNFKSNYLQTEGVNPKLEEVTRFASNAEDGTENLDLSALAATIKSNSAGAFVPGDMVEIYQGEQRGVFGRAKTVHNDIVSILVTEGSLKGQLVESPIKGLRKLFREGDHVKVIGGSKYYDEVGMVVKIMDDRVTILTDANQTEITVFSKDLREATDSGGQVGVSKFDLYDLVQLDVSTVACVIKVDRESLVALDQTGTIRSLLFTNISNRLERRIHAVAIDRDGSEVRPDDLIKEYGGENRAGQVLHIHRNFLFAQTRLRTENNGVFVVRTSNVTTIAAKGGRATSASAALTKMNPAMQRNGAAGQPNGGAMPPPRQMGRDRLIGKTVAAKRGNYKGLIGRVVDTTEDSARVELYTKKNIITVKKDDLTVRDQVTGEVIQSDVRRPGGMPAPGNRTSYGGATPGRPFGMTPRAADGGRTPAWKSATAPAGGRTPAWQQSGGRTAYGGGGGSGKTPAWQGGAGNMTAYGGGTAYGGQTSYGGATAYGGGGGGGTAYGGVSTALHAGVQDADSFQTTYNTSARTPHYTGGTAYDQGGRTPGYLDAPTPGFNSAPTPGAGVNHPTPGYGQYQTPGGAPTPGGYPETPGAWNAETPAADNGPSYD